MKHCQCTHKPHVVRITFDVGNNQTKSFELCRYCQEFDEFQDYIITKESIPENNKTAEVRFSHITSANTPPSKEMIT